jgi:hypothetical protein
MPCFCDSWASGEQSLVRRKLHQVLQEGLLDSVLPYLVPKNCNTSSAVGPGKRLADTKLRLNVASVQQQLQQQHAERSPPRRKHTQISRTHKTVSKPE